MGEACLGQEQAGWEELNEQFSLSESLIKFKYPY